MIAGGVDRSTTKEMMYYGVMNLSDINRDSPRYQEEILASRVGYQWPASAITEGHRRKLVIMSNRMNRPVNAILTDSIDHMYSVFKTEKAALDAQRLPSSQTHEQAESQLPQ